MASVDALATTGEADAGPRQHAAAPVVVREQLDEVVREIDLDDGCRSIDAHQCRNRGRKRWVAGVPPASAIQCGLRRVGGELLFATAVCQGAPLLGFSSVVDRASRAVRRGYAYHVIRETEPGEARVVRGGVDAVPPLPAGFPLLDQSPNVALN